MAKHPTLTVKPLRMTAPERTVEVSFPDGKGCLIHCWVRADGVPVVSIERGDKGMCLLVPLEAEPDPADSHRFTT